MEVKRDLPKEIRLVGVKCPLCEFKSVWTTPKVGIYECRSCGSVIELKNGFLALCQ